MKKKLPIIWNRRAFLLLFLFQCSVLLVSAQQSKLKTQAANPKSASSLSGHNNVRKLSSIYDKEVSGNGSKPAPVGDDAQLRRLYELELLKDPTTGLIPEGIREKELAFAQQMQTLANKAGRAATGTVINDWHARGPFNVGGRTRALAIDLDNENILLAGGVSGGMWRSENGGASWAKTTGTNDLQSVTSIVQDPRAGFRNVWYYSTGERIGNSASGAGAFFSGNGIYKSIDGGRTWQLLPSIADNLPQINSPYDLIFNLAVHPASGDLYVATWWGIHRSQDGGSSFAEVLAGGTDNWTDVMITPSGAIYASIESDGVPNKGIFRSLDGTTWTNVTPTGFPGTGTIWGRTVLGYTPSNENIIYVYADNATGNGRAFLWRYTYDPVTPSWINLTASLPAFGGSVGNLNTQGGYNMVVKVHPSDPNIVFIGATNLYRSTNGFTSTGATTWVGGYSPLNNVSVYPNQHPDQHALVFYPSNPTKALSGNDGGVQVTESILANNPSPEPVLWTSLNNGYLTTQPYALSFNSQGTGEQLMAGFQDNGTWFTNSDNLTTPWAEMFTGDGSYNLFADNGLTRYVSSQSGNVYRFNYASADAVPDDYVSFTRVRPAVATGFGFIAPFILDPNDDNIMYMPAGTRMWRNDNLDGIPLFSNAATSVNWNNLANSAVPTGNTITALAVSRMPANRLYYGTNRGLVFRIDNANIGDQPKIDVATGKGLPIGNVSCITVDPTNADRVFVVFSNYNINSIFYSDNGGTSWTNISGNLEQTPTGTGNGPSVRWLAIEGNSDKYYVGTSTGLYATTVLTGTTTWAPQNVAGIGNVVVPMVRTREDGFVAVATHGNGLYSAKFEVTPLPQPTLKVVNPIADIDLVVNNTPNTIINLNTVFVDTNGDPISYSIINTNPALVTAAISGSILTLSYTAAAKGKSTIGVIAASGTESISDVFNVTIRDLEANLYNQSTLQSGTRPSQLFTDFGNSLAQSADDFIIPVGQTWSIEKVTVPGAVNGAPVLNAARVIIFKDTVGAPGVEIYNSGLLVPASGTANPALDLRLTTPANLNAGKFWISVYVQLAFGTGNQWFWATTNTLTGSEARFRDPSDLFGSGAIDWTTQSGAFGGTPVDMLFALFGKATGVPAPTIPTGLTALYQSPIKFNLNWMDNSSNEIGFIVERSTNGTTFAKRTTVGSNVAFYSDTDLFDPLLSYYYRVAAIGVSDTSAYSNIAVTAVIPAAPKAKLASYVTPFFFVANWESTPGAVSYELDVSSDGFVTFFSGFNGKSVTGTSFKVRNTLYNKHYEYRLRAINAGGKSENSNVITVASIRNLRLASVCSDNPTVTRRWKVTNPNPFEIEATWFVYRTNQTDTISVPPGVSYFTTNTVPNSSNTVFLLWKDDWMFTRLAVRYSCKTQCTGVNNDVAIIDGRDRQTDYTDVETDVPFIVEAWPNPAKEKFSILVSSPFEDEVGLELYDTKGNRVRDLKVQSNSLVEIDAREYASGTYILKVNQLIYSESIKLAKE
ncbi:MAG: T9SS type A sorting domain-containing protein [Cyclobacteriaceae bacterium]